MRRGASSVHTFLSNELPLAPLAMKSVQAIQQRKWWPFAAAFVTGTLSALSFAPADIWPLMFFSFAVLFGLLQRTETLKQALLIGWLFGLGQFIISLNWIATAFTYQA